MTPARRLAVVLLALACSAIGLWVATRLVWFHVDYQSALRGPGLVRVTGGQARPELAAVALLALAAGAAAVAVSGWPRRVLGGLVALVGAWAVALALTSPAAPVSTPNSGDAAATLTGTPGQLPADAVPVGFPTWTAAPHLAAASAALLALAGIALVGWANALPRLGARYAAPGSGRRTPDRDSEWWTALDAGEDPTLPRQPGTDPGASR